MALMGYRGMACLWRRLAQSPFRRRFSLSQADVEYLRTLSRQTRDRHIREVLSQRLGPAKPTHDGRQTPMRGKPRGHPVFPAQHATATCCRSCLAKWHHIPQGQPLTPDQLEHLSGVIKHWLDAQAREHGVKTLPRPDGYKSQPTLF